VLVWFVRGIATALGAAVAALAAAVASPRASVKPARWMKAARFSDLDPGVPTPIVIAPSSADGWHRARRPRVVFLTATEAGEVTALSATCTHLGCRVSWNAGTSHFECPCHKGAYDRDGRVVSGPPPAPLPPVAARVDLTADEVHVEI
jgi:Rieske Fe-S protein